MDSYTAGNPMNEDVKWSYLSLTGLVEAFLAEGIKVSVYTVRYLLSINKYGFRKMAKVKAIGEHSDKNTQFEYIAQLIESKKTDESVLILSIDTKKKEDLGPLFREGRVHTQEALRTLDHDYANLSTGKLVPHGIYDLKSNQLFMNIGVSSDTSEFAKDCLGAYWDKQAKEIYANVKEIIIFSDGGGSNRSSGFLYKQAIQDFANHTQKTIRVCHYPPYCSKYNPIEHRAFPHVTRALSGVVLDTIQTVKHLIEQKATTKQGFKTSVNVIDKAYQIGKKISQDTIDAINITLDTVLEKWNYVIKPNNTNSNIPNLSQ